jgi:hypothetical protein
MTPTGAGTLRAGKGRAVLAGGSDRARVLRMDRAHGQEDPAINACRGHGGVQSWGTTPASTTLLRNASPVYSLDEPAHHS